MKEELAKIREALEYLSLQRTDDMADSALAGLNRIEAAMSEPFGYFRAEPFGWTDCAEDDEGAKALYEMPPLQKGESNE